jgi:hypothetical protein
MTGRWDQILIAGRWTGSYESRLSDDDPHVEWSLEPRENAKVFELAWLPPLLCRGVVGERPCEFPRLEPKGPLLVCLSLCDW